jgi:hypothetical protein
LVLFLLPLGIIIAYPAAGIALNRFVARRVLLWRQANSLQNVAQSNVQTIVTWPIAIPRFLVSLALAKLF